jgi:hypothetical protein
MYIPCPKRLVALCAAGVFTLTLLCPASAAAPITPRAAVQEEMLPEEGAEMEAVINAIRVGIVEAQRNNVAGFPNVKSIEITLNTVAAKSTGGKLSFWIFTIGSKKTYETSSAVKVAMMPPPKKDAAGGPAAPVDNVATALGRAINLAKHAFITGNSDEPKIQFNSAEIEIKFTVKKEGSVGGKVEILPLGFEGESKIDKSKIHTLKLVFGV